MKPGERVVTLSGATETVAWVHAVAGQADYYNLTVAADHTYAVGDSRAVVHNVCDPTISPTVEAAGESNASDQVAFWEARDALAAEQNIPRGAPNYPRAPTAGTVVYEGAYEGVQSGIEGTAAAGHAEWQATNDAIDTVSELAGQGVSGDLQVMIISGNPLCPTCETSYGAWTNEIQAAAAGTDLNVSVRFLWYPPRGMVGFYP